MTTKTAHTLRLIDRLAGVPHLLESRPAVVVPRKAFSFMLDNMTLDWRKTFNSNYVGLLFRLKNDAHPPHPLA
jgi:hypothetical protein